MGVHLTSRHIAVAVAGVLLASLGAGHEAVAQVPDAGRLMEAPRRDLSLSPMAPPPLVSDDAAVALPADDGVSFAVEGFRLRGHAAFDTATLLGLLADAAPRTHTLGSLTAAVQGLTDHYRAEGFPFARAYLPAQEIANGVVEIAIVEGTLGAVHITNGAGLGDMALGPLAALTPGETVRSAPLERALLLANELPGTTVRGSLRPGEAPGTTDLLVDVAPGAAVTGAVEVDNHGNRHAGAWRLGGNVAWNNPLSRGDQLTLRALGSNEALYSGVVGYQAPITAMGTRAGVSVSTMTYALGGDFEALEAHGRAHTVSVHLLHPLHRSRQGRLDATVQADHKWLTDKIGAVNSSASKRTGVLRSGLAGSANDGLGGGGRTTFSATHSIGRLWLDRPSGARDAATARSQGTFQKIEASLSRLQSITTTTSLFLSGRAQQAFDNLDSSETFGVGGAAGVRAHPQGEASGDSGILLTAEIRQVLPLPGALWQARLFADTGTVRVDHDPWTSGQNLRSRNGVGVGLDVIDLHGFTVSTAAAWRIGPQPTSDRDRRPRLWLQVVRAF